MITAEEAGLTTDQWNALKAQLEGGVFKVQAYRWNPQFALQVAGSNISPAFDAIRYDGTIYKISTAGAEYLSDGDWLSVTGYTPATGASSSVPPSMVTNSDFLYVFVKTNTGISVNSYDGADWSGWDEIVTDSTVAFMAATAFDTVHFVVYDSTNRRFRFKVAVDDGGWAITSSQIHWGFQITSFAAKRIAGVDSLAFSTELPGLITKRTINTKLIKTYTPSGGIACLVYKYGSWSDHINVDYVDQWTTFRYRLCVRMSIIGDTLWLTSYSSDGTKLTPITGYRAYSSKDGKHWSHGDLLPLPVNSNRGVILLLDSHILYAITNGDVYTANSTLRFDADPHYLNVIDISHWVNNLSISRQDMQQITLTIDNVNNRLGSTFLNGSFTCALRVKTGIWYEPDLANIFVQTGLFEVDSIEPSQDNPGNFMDISARDRMAWLTTKTQSETFRYWQPQVNAGDEYIDITDTGYGGMTHTAPVIGSFKASDGYLQTITSNEEAQAESTFLDDTTWNGALQTWFSLSTLANAEYAGIIFWATDKDNFVGFIYKQSDDKLRLVRRRGGSDDSPYWLSSTKSWSGSLNGRYLRIEVYYCRIRLYVNTEPNGGPLVWVLEQEVIIPGQAAFDGQIQPDGLLLGVTAPNPQSGIMGMIARGYSPADNYSPAPEPIPEPTLPDGYELLLPPALSAPLRFWIAGSTYNSSMSSIQHGSASRLQIDELGAGDWESFGPVHGLPTVSLTALGGRTNPFDFEEKLLAYPVAIYQGRIWDTTPVFTLLVTPSTVFTGIGVFDVLFTGLYLSQAVEGFMVVTARSVTGDTNALIGRSFDGGDTWTWTVIFAGSSGGNDMQIAMSSWDGVMYAWKADDGFLYKSLDFGDTWGIGFTVTVGVDPGNARTIEEYIPSEYVVPYRKVDGTPNYAGALVYMIAQQNWNEDPDDFISVLYRSDDGGGTFFYVSHLPVYNPGVVNFSTPSSNLYVHPSNGAILKIAAHGHLYTSEDSGITWDDLVTGLSPDFLRVEGWAYSTNFAVMYSRTGTHNGTVAAYYTEDGINLVSLNAPDHDFMGIPFSIEADLTGVL